MGRGGLAQGERGGSAAATIMRTDGGNGDRDCVVHEAHSTSHSAIVISCNRTLWESMLTGPLTHYGALRAIEDWTS